MNYAGACRDYAFVNDGEGHILPPKVRRTPAEQQRFEHWGKRKITSQSVNDLAAVVYGLESVITDMDMRLEGNKAVIAAPYAEAVWNQIEQTWEVSLNSECKTKSGK